MPFAPDECLVPPTLRRFARAGSRGRRLIRLTALIDVVFILLVFFMLASSFLDWRTIELDSPASPIASTAMDGALLVEVRANGVRLAGETVSLEVLAARVRARLAARPEQRVVVRPAPGVTLQDTITVLDTLTGAGARALSLVHGPRG